MMERLTVTGLSGFVGGHLRDEAPCEALSRPDGDFLDLRDADAVMQAVGRSKPNYVVHLAAQSFVPASFEDPRQTIDVNLIGTLNLLAALEAHGFQGRFLFVGSGAMYGPVPSGVMPVTEFQPLRPASPYAVSKVAAEAICLQLSQFKNYDLLAVRPFNHIGPGQLEQFSVSSFAKQIVEVKLGRRDPVLQVGDVDVTRDFTDVRDVVRAYTALLESGKSGEVYNVCSGTETCLRTLIEQMAVQAGVTVSIEQDPARLRKSDQRRMLGDASKLQQATGWSPQIPIEQTIKDVLDYWEKVLA